MPQRPSLHREPWHKPIEQREQQRQQRLDQQRPSSASRGYDGRWQKLRAVYLANNPSCSVRGCYELAVDVDHITSVRERPDLRLQWWNLRGLCHRCHSRRTAIEQGFGAARRRKR